MRTRQLPDDRNKIHQLASITPRQASEIFLISEKVIRGAMRMNANPALKHILNADGSKVTTPKWVEEFQEARAKATEALYQSADQIVDDVMSDIQKKHLMPLPTDLKT